MFCFEFNDKSASRQIKMQSECMFCSARVPHPPTISPIRCHCLKVDWWCHSLFYFTLSIVVFVYSGLFFVFCLLVSLVDVVFTSSSDKVLPFWFDDAKNKFFWLPSSFALMTFLFLQKHLQPLKHGSLSPFYLLLHVVRYSFASVSSKRC